MKKSDIVNAIFNRKPILIVAYLKLEKESRRNEAPKKGQNAESFFAKHSLLWGKEVLELTAFANSQQELDAMQPIAPEFTVMAFEVKSYESTKFGNRVNGTLHRIDADEPAKK